MTAPTLQYRIHAPPHTYTHANLLMTIVVVVGENYTIDTRNGDVQCHLGVGECECCQLQALQYRHRFTCGCTLSEMGVRNEIMISNISGQTCLLMDICKILMCLHTSNFPNGKQSGHADASRLASRFSHEID